LVDTFDTLRSGVPNAIRVAREYGDRINFLGIRLDSGDIAYLSKEARKMLDEAGFPDAKIVVSNDLDEVTIMSLLSQGATVDRKSTRLNSSHVSISYAVFCLKKKNRDMHQ